MDTSSTYHTVMPYLIVPDADAVVAFAKAAFGGTELYCARRPDGRIAHAEVRIGDSVVMVGQADAQWKARPAALYLWIGDVDGTYKRALDAGAASESAPENKPYGHRAAGVDMGGITWWLAAAAG
jgi:PhnB protein